MVEGFDKARDAHTRVFARVLWVLYEWPLMGFLGPNTEFHRLYSKNYYGDLRPLYQQ